MIGADLNSRKLDETDRSTVVLFGDGAGAVILEASVARRHYFNAFTCIASNQCGIATSTAERGVEKYWLY